MKRLIVMDMDGTLLNHEKKITPLTLQALIEQEKKGAHLVLASGRPKSRLMEYALKLQMDTYNGFLIESNGSAIYDVQNNKQHVIRTMQHKEADVIVQYVRENYPSHDIVIMSKNYAFLNTPENGPQNTSYNRKTIEQLKNRQNREFKDVKEVDETFYKVCVFDEVENIESILNDLQSKFSKHYWIGRVAPFWIEITPIEMNKGNALHILMEQLNISKENVYIFGDGENDLSMMSVAHSVAMGNAFDHVKAQCEYVTEDNDHDGIAIFIQEHLL